MHSFIYIVNICASVIPYSFIYSFAHPVPEGPGPIGIFYCSVIFENVNNKTNNNDKNEAYPMTYLIEWVTDYGHPMKA